MPRAKLVNQPVVDVAALGARLMAEWQRPGPADGAPIIIVEGEKDPRAGIHVLVIWDAWTDLHREKRGELVMDAYAATTTAANVLRVTLALGLTTAEAEEMKLRYEIE